MIVITRPKEDAEALAKALRAKGRRVLTEPLLYISLLKPKQLASTLARKPQAIIATSRHALTAFAKINKERGIPVKALGKATAAHARTLGFKATAASGSAEALITFIKKRCSPDKGRLLYIRGVDISTDIVSELKPHGFRTDSVTLYKATPAAQLSKALRDALKSGRVQAVMFFSERTATTYLRLIRRYKLQAAHHTVNAISLSKTIAAQLHALPWKKIRVAEKPNIRMMLKAIDPEK